MIYYRPQASAGDDTDAEEQETVVTETQGHYAAGVVRGREAACRAYYDGTS
ncbi:MAG: hypothetical protein R2867_36030 [Caldilineaceae bacterium]